MADPLHARAAAELASGPLEAPPPGHVSASRARSAPGATSIAASSVPGAVPLRIPAILRLQAPKSSAPVRKERFLESSGSMGSRKAGGAVAPGGKRRRRRWENAQLAGNPHLHRPSRADFSPGPPLKDLSTTFAPPPATFSRSTYISSSPSATPPSAAALAAAAAHGQFSMSLRGLRRTLRTALGGAGPGRRGGGRAEEVLELMERELCAWLTLTGRIPEGFFHESTGSGSAASWQQACAHGKVLDPTPVDDWVSPPAVEPLPDLPLATASSKSSQPRSTPSSSSHPPPTLTELSRQPHALVWLAPSPHHRFLLHALARYYSLSSFSRPLSPLEPTIRVTHLLRPQLARTAARSVAGIGAGVETPPGTDWTAVSSGLDNMTTTGDELTASDMDGGFDTDTDTDVGSVQPGGDEDEDEDDRPSDWAERPVGTGGTDDEAEAEYSSATESSSAEADNLTAAENDTGDEDEDADVLASRLAHLGVATAAPTTPRRASPLGPSRAPQGGAQGGGAAVAMAVSSPLARGSATPRAASAAAPFSPVPSATPLAARPADRPRGRRSLPDRPVRPAEGDSSAAESSPSRSPTRTGGLSARAAFVGGAGAGEWRLPERDFIAWILDDPI